MNVDTLFSVFGFGLLLCPAASFAVMGLTMLVGRPLTERATARLSQMAVIADLVMAIAVLGLMLLTGTRDVPIEFGDWIVLHGEDFHLHLSFVFDRLSIPFAILSLVLVGTIGAFANHYLHRETGYRRFFLLYGIFLLGMIVVSLAGTIETLFLGWELVGLSSALLVAYFHERRAPVVNGQRIWSIYRVADAAFLIAAVTMHHLRGEGKFSLMMGQGPWPDGKATLTSTEALVVGLSLLVAAAGKSGLIPFSGWLPRAMEGPTPSSAVFYGALSVHLGDFLLLRVSPILDQSNWLCAAIVLLGLGTALFAAMATRVQTDVKSVLAFASLTQVGIITMEIGLGLRYIALIHIIGHACLRTLQLVRAPTLLHDYHTMENALGANIPVPSELPEAGIPWRLRPALYRMALERGYFDAIIDEYFVRPFVRLFRWCDTLERRWTDKLAGVHSREYDAATATAPSENSS